MRRFFAMALILLTSLISGAEFPTQVERWNVFEITLKGPRKGNPFTDVTLSAVFKLGETTFQPKGFYDGNGIYRIRFMPDKEGRWSFETKSNIKKLNGQTGIFECTAPVPGNHGPVGVRNTFHFAFADGTPYRQIGTTCYAWAHQGDKMEEQTLKTLAASPFNKLRMCVFPKDYVYSKNEPEYYIFPRQNDKNDLTRFNPDFWHHFEKRIQDLQALSIEADLILFHPYDRWGYANMTDEQDDFYLEYAIARLAAYRNVWWSLANEFDFMEAKSMEDWDRIFRVITENDPYDRLRGIHNGRIKYDHTKPWVSHASIQSSDFSQMKQWQELYQKPIVYDECRYEGNIPQGWGNISAEEMVHRFWLATVAGCYCGHGETYRHPDDILWWSKGGVLHGESPKRIAFLKTILEDSPEEGIDWITEGVGGKSGAYYLYYFGRDTLTSYTFDLPPYNLYSVEILNVWDMTIQPVEGFFRQAFTINLPKKPFTAVRIKRVAFDFPAEPVEIQYPGNLFIDKAKVILSHRRHKNIHFTLDGSPPTEASGLYEGPITITQNETKVRAFSTGKNNTVSKPVERTFYKTGLKPAVKLKDVSPGLLCRLYRGVWNMLPDFTQLSPVEETVEALPDCNKQANQDQFGLVFDGYIRIPKDDVYGFSTNSDDGSRLIIDGKRIIDNDGVHGALEKEGFVGLAKGCHPIQIQFFENVGGELLSVYWQSTQIEKQLIPADVLFHKK